MFIDGEYSVYQRFLMSKGAQLDVRDKELKNVIHYAAIHNRLNILSYLCDFTSKKQQSQQSQQQQITSFVSLIDAKDLWGMTPLQYCCIRGDKEVLS
jgi:ankyrin repeat protein